MKAIVYTEYGSPDVLQFREVERPIPKDTEVLVQVHAASINYGDWGLLRGRPFFLRLTEGGLQKPKIKILGGDVAGRIEPVGRNAKQFQRGDPVFGDLSDCGRGGFAEYVCATEDKFALKPANISFEEAAAVPEDLALLAELFKAGKVVPVIDRRYPLSEVPEALRYLEAGHVQGKLVITM